MAWSAAGVAVALLACAATRDTGPHSSPPRLLGESWNAYTAKFIQKDGRVIDHWGGGISTSEGQAYAMLRAVWMDDRATFENVYRWAVNNLNAGVRRDRLWAWKWGKAPDGKWRVLDRAFATDADEDAALALLLAYQRWKDRHYLSEARAVLADLRRLAVVRAAGRMYLLAGDTLCKGSVCRVNPSYYAPYAYRLFQRADPGHRWNELVDASYGFLEAASNLSATGLPPDWVQLDTATGVLRPGSAKDSEYSYDAFRVHWRVALDYHLFREPRAARYLQSSLAWIDTEWKKLGALPAAICSSGRPGAAYESLEMLAGLLPGLAFAYPETAEAVSARLQAAYSQGYWGNRDSYYLQNWAWFGVALDQRYLAPFAP